MKSKILVGLQFFLILIMTLPFGTESQNLYLGSFVMLLGGVVGLLALQENRLENFNIRPDIKEGAELIESGVYAYIRHPMYSAVLIVMLGVVLLYPVPFEFVSYILLWGVLLMKLFYEERLWKFREEKYATYMQRTRRLIPFVF